MSWASRCRWVACHSAPEVKAFLLPACVAIAAQAFFSFAQAADAAHGKQLYESRCIGCHSIDDNRVGPAHRGVFGRKAGSAKGYDYSPAVKSSKIVWSAKTLDRCPNPPMGPMDR